MAWAISLRIWKLKLSFWQTWSLWMSNTLEVPAQTKICYLFSLGNVCSTHGPSCLYHSLSSSTLYIQTSVPTTTPIDLWHTICAYFHRRHYRKFMTYVIWLVEEGYVHTCQSVIPQKLISRNEGASWQQYN